MAVVVVRAEARQVVAGWWWQAWQWWQPCMYLLLLCELGLQRLDADVSRLVHQLAELDAHHLREPDGGVVDLQRGSGEWLERRQGGRM